MDIGNLLDAKIFAGLLQVCGFALGSPDPPAKCETAIMDNRVPLTTTSQSYSPTAATSFSVPNSPGPQVPLRFSNDGQLPLVSPEGERISGPRGESGC